MSFCYLRFFQKTNKKNRLNYYGTSSRIVFVRFLEELKTPKRHFEINWPLVKFSEELSQEKTTSHGSIILTIAICDKWLKILFQVQNGTRSFLFLNSQPETPYLYQAPITAKLKRLPLTVNLIHRTLFSDLSTLGAGQEKAK